MVWAQAFRDKAKKCPDSAQFYQGLSDCFGSFLPHEGIHLPASGAMFQKIR